MSYKSKATERRNRLYVGMSAVLVFVIAFSSLASLFVQNQQAPTIPPTATPTPVVPTPVADLNTIGFDSQVLAQSGLFSVAVPTGWSVSTNNATINESQLSLRNEAAQSVIEARVIAPTTPITDVAGVQAFFTNDWLRQSWQGYAISDDILNRASREVQGDDFIMDFGLKQGQRDFIARQVAWADGDWLYVVRVVTPPNANAQLLYLLENVRNSLKPNKQLVGQPFDWSSYFDSTNKYLVRYPSNWQVTDSAVGAPTSLAGDNATLRIETIATTVADEATATSWVESTYGASVTSVQAVEQFGATGFGVAYQIPNIDGGSTSGYAVLLNGEGNVSVADLRIPTANIDLNDEATAQQYSTFKSIVNSFGIFNDITVTA
jgi:hypothetical protein